MCTTDVLTIGCPSSAPKAKYHLLFFKNCAQGHHLCLWGGQTLGYWVAWNYLLLIPKLVLSQALQFTFIYYILYDDDSNFNLQCCYENKEWLFNSQEVITAITCCAFLDSVFIDAWNNFKWFGTNFSFTWICKTYHLSKAHTEWSQFPSLLFARTGIRNFDDLVKSLTQEIKPNNKTKQPKYCLAEMWHLQSITERRTQYHKIQWSSFQIVQKMLVENENRISLFSSGF